MRRNTLLALVSVSKSYGSVAAVDDVSLDVEQGARIAVVGASGSGKTSLLRLIAGFDMPDAGQIVLGDTIMAGPGVRVPAHLRGVGFVTQDGSLFPHLDVAENISFGMRDTGEARRKRVDELLGMVGLDASMGSRRPDQLSGGQQQRIALARALAQRPRLMLLDEPFSALDARLRATTRRNVVEVLADAEMTSILVTHDHEEALSSADKIAVMIKGKVAQFGPPRDVYWRPRTAAVAKLLGEAIVLAAEIESGVARTGLGPLGVASNGAAGASACIMLRPEQIRISDADVANSAARATARVEGIEFAGGRSRLTLALLPIDGAGNGRPATRIALWHSGLTCPTPGSLIGLSVDGDAHVLDEAPAGEDMEN